MCPEFDPNRRNLVEDRHKLQQESARLNTEELPLVSIIVCAYNAGIFIAETLKSLLAQTYPKVEIIVVDDGSTDETARIVQTYGSKVRYIHQPNMGPSAARNKGIDASVGELLCFFDADDLMPPERVSLQVEFLQRHRGVRLVFSDYRNFSDTGLAERTHFDTCPRLKAMLQGKTEIILENASAILSGENFGITGTMLMHRGLLSQVPGFETRLRCSEDFHFYYRLARHTPVGILNREGMLRRMHAHNLSSNWERLLPDNIHSYSQLRDAETDIQARRLLNSHIADCWAALARHSADHRRYKEALRNDMKALITAPQCNRLMRTLYNSTRTTAMAFGLYKPRND